MSGQLEFHSNQEADSKIVTMSVLIGCVAYAAMKLVQGRTFSSVNSVLADNYNITPKDI